MLDLFTWDFGASSEWVTLIASLAGTDWVVVCYSTLSVPATETRTWVSAGLLHACCHLTTLRAHQALRSAVGRRTNHVS
jgi:hypothetical protein